MKKRRTAVKASLAAKDYNMAFNMLMAESSDSEPGSDSDEDFDEMTQRLLVKTDCVVRVYVLDAFDLAQRDENSLSDPYLLVKLGKKVYGDKENYQEDKTNCGFF